jgi:hypothetical protein
MGVSTGNRRFQQDLQINSVEMLTAPRCSCARWAGVHMKELQQAMATLAFRHHEGGSPYKHLFEERQWTELVQV